LYSYKDTPKKFVRAATGFAAKSRNDGRVLALVAPGQGAQTPGFLAPWLELPTFVTRLAWLSAVSGLDLAHYGTQADAETIRDTAVAQPLLVAAGLTAALELFPSPSQAFRKVGVVAGHSVGEITAAAGTNVITVEAAMVLVRERGKAMAAASAAWPTSMSAVIGGDRDDVMAALAAYGLTAANDNGSGQVVAGGTAEQLAELAANPPRRTRIVPLSVAGAFHTVHMEPAVAHMESLVKAVSTKDPRTRLLSNADGQVIQSGAEYVKRIVRQIANPVRWDLCMATMSELGVTGLLELPPAGTLTGIAKRNLKGVELFSLNTPDQLDEARDFVDRHADDSHYDLSTTPSWRLVVSPGKGRFTRDASIAVNDRLSPDTTIGAVTNLRDEVRVSATYGGVVLEWLVEDDDPVSPGQPLLRLHPSPSTLQEDLA
jgi:[acyl-carrier-protein] S-malonyltransferase